MPDYDPMEPEVLAPDQEVPVAEVNAALDPLTRAEIDMQISTARRFPRDIAKVKKDMVAMATLDEQVAEGCYYSLKRSSGEGKGSGLIEGPSIRLAEIALSCYGNVRAATRSLGETEDGRFIRSLGVVHDVEKNVMVAREVTRRITNKYGKRYSDDMVGVTMAAASAIALRNATLTVVPRSLVKPAYDAARDVALGKAKSLGQRRLEVIAQLQKISPLITTDRILAVVEKRSVDEMDWDSLRILIGLKTAMKDGLQSVEEAFPDPGAGATSVGEILGGGKTAPPASSTPNGSETSQDTPGVAARRGSMARVSGRPRTECPYPAGPLADAWQAGWDEEAPQDAGTAEKGQQVGPETKDAEVKVATPAAAETSQKPTEGASGGGSLFDEPDAGGGGKKKSGR